MKKTVVLSLFLIVFNLLLVSSISFAQSESANAPSLGGNLQDVATGVGYTQPEQYDQPFGLVVARALRAFFGMLGIIFLIIMLYAGFRWMTAGGKQDQIDEAKKWIINAVIGLAICTLSYAITVYVGSIVGEVGTPHYQYYD
ncbi:MAG: hypothetical protein WC310_05290 [Patescibacteria group bacterium]|jgi:cbb3-type cytochrome oxidase subunit 3